jgi:hypothetical protein
MFVNCPGPVSSTWREMVTAIGQPGLIQMREVVYEADLRRQNADAEVKCESSKTAGSAKHGFAHVPIRLPTSGKSVTRKMAARHGFRNLVKL